MKRAKECMRERERDEGRRREVCCAGVTTSAVIVSGNWRMAEDQSIHVTGRKTTHAEKTNFHDWGKRRGTNRIIRVLM